MKTLLLIILSISSFSAFALSGCWQVVDRNDGYVFFVNFQTPTTGTYVAPADGSDETGENFKSKFKYKLSGKDLKINLLGANVAEDSRNIEIHSPWRPFANFNEYSVIIDGDAGTMTVANPAFCK